MHLCFIFQFKENGIQMFRLAQNVSVVAVDGNTYSNKIQESLVYTFFFSLLLPGLICKTEKNFQILSLLLFQKYKAMSSPRLSRHKITTYGAERYIYNIFLIYSDKNNTEVADDSTCICMQVSKLDSANMDSISCRQIQGSFNLTIFSINSSNAPAQNFAKGSLASWVPIPAAEAWAAASSLLLVSEPTSSHTAIALSSDPSGTEMYYKRILASCRREVCSTDSSMACMWVCNCTEMHIVH